MAKKTTTTAPAKPKETKAAATDAASPKADATSTEAATASDAAPTGDATAAPKKSSGSSRPISYFSSVSTDEYRAGWAEIFGKPATKRAKPKPASKLPMTLELDAESLDPAARDAIEALFRQQARKKRLNYDKLAANDQVRLQISCIISE